MIKRYAKDTKLVIELSIIDTIFSINIFLTFVTFVISINHRKDISRRFLISNMVKIMKGS